MFKCGNQFFVLKIYILAPFAGGLKFATQILPLLSFSVSHNKFVVHSRVVHVCMYENSLC